MDALYEKYRWEVWKEHKQEIVEKFANFDKSDWDFIRSSVDDWIDEHVEDWCDYAMKNYVKPVEKTPEYQAKNEVANHL